MFGKKKKNLLEDKEESKVKARMFVIPEIFYGGKDPVIYKKHVGNDSKVVVDEKKDIKKEPEKKPTPKIEKPHPTPKPVDKGAIQKPVLRKQTSYKKWLLPLGVLLVILMVGVYAFFIRGKNSSNEELEQKENTPPTQTEEVVSVINSPDSNESPTSTEDIFEEVPTSTPSLDESLLEFPRILLADSIDLDKDGLTDKEEEVFDTDSGKKDTDDDGYSDGQEIRNLYNPKGFAPVKLIDSGLVQEYTNRNWGYHVYHPKTWKLGEVDYDGTQVLLSAIEGDYIEIRAFSKENGESFQDWFAKSATGEKYSDLQEIETSFGIRGLVRKDKLVAYFYTPNQVFVFIYHPGVTDEIAYRLIMQMVIESFQPQNSNVSLPEQPVVPQEGDTTEESATSTPMNEMGAETSVSSSQENIFSLSTSTIPNSDEKSTSTSTTGGEEYSDYNDLF